LLTSDSNLPIALRPAVAFEPVRGSIFDDPGDEKSWHISQRSDGLMRFFEGRKPSWYASAIAPLEGADRVLDLGCGPGLTLEALLDQGCASVVGIDRWPAFTANSAPLAPILAHDLTLPMPFLESGSFDGVLSHYALDYVSPIGMRQVLREAHRVLAPGGRLVVYVAAVGLGSGDPARTIAYSPPALRTLLHESGFDEIDVEATSNGRNSVAKARRPAGGLESGRLSPGEARASIDGDTQLSTSFSGGGDRVELELTGRRRSATIAFDLPPAHSPDDSRVSVCARALRSGPGRTELQLWAWRGYEPVASDCARFEFAAEEMRVDCAGSIEHLSVWSPGELFVEPAGNAHARFDDLPPGGDLSDAQRGAEGRQVVVESAGEAAPEAGDWLGPGRNRFLIERASGTDPAAIDQAWLAGHAHGIVLGSEELDGDRHRELLLWAGWRQALVFVEGPEWEGILAAVSSRQAEMRGPVVLVDPALGNDAPPRPVPAEMVEFVAGHDRFFLVLGAGSRECSPQGDLGRLERCLLHGGPPSDDEKGMAEASESLRYLTERTVLMQLRQAHGYSPAEVGRRLVSC
jgi:SAM-dependent methyltransferase